MPRTIHEQLRGIEGCHVEHDHLLNTIATVIACIGIAVIAVTSSGCGNAEILVGGEAAGPVDRNRDVPGPGQAVPNDPGGQPGEVEPPVDEPGPTPTPGVPFFRAEALAELDDVDAAYVVGHALGIAVYQRTLPRYLVGTGYTPPFGASAEEAPVFYAFSDVVDDEANTGDCVVIEGSAPICPDDTTEPLEDGETIDDRVDGDLNPVEGDGDAEDDGDPSDSDEEDDNAPETPTPDDPFIDDDCETFLDPAAVEARQLLSTVDPRAILESAGFGPAAEISSQLVARFEEGRFDSLALEDLDEDENASEPENLKPFFHETEICSHSPLVLDVDGDGIESGDPSDGVLFDLKEVGAPVRTAWPKGSDPLLVMDRNGDGKITHGGELFGNSRIEAFGDARRANGFAALAELDVNLDGVVNATDPAFAKLQLWRDLDRDGVSDDGELQPLALHRVTALSTSFVDAVGSRDASGNDTRMRGVFWRATPAGTVETGTMVDVWFRIQSAVAPITRR